MFILYIFFSAFGFCFSLKFFFFKLILTFFFFFQNTFLLFLSICVSLNITFF
ncbi:expressed protein [Phakopsora pachyrhizi]|uniref:Expressed protein n=1 Tax=Phakopsora pachyrhizi TaxID=170000 RepID=A0AAV0ADL4_PHAPC|nr:expressed protein [Phakopsora pachyrhizi]